jgi:hypothetical protein
LKEGIFGLSLAKVAVIDFAKHAFFVEKMPESIVLLE